MYTTAGVRPNRSTSLRLLTASVLLSTFAVVCVSCHPLDDYVFRDDPAYTWEEAESFTGEGYRAFSLRMTSQRWGEGWVVPEYELWYHVLTIVVPDNVRSPNLGVLRMVGGDRALNLPRPGGRDLDLTIEIALKSGLITSVLYQVPSQPIVFADDEDAVERTEDDFIAYTWKHFSEDPNEPNPELLARFPMTKAGVRGIDTVIAFVEERIGLRLSQFVVSGASKRGWTSWTVAAVDKRVVAGIPLVMDMLNLVENIKHQYQMLDGWSFALADYYVQGTTLYIDDPRSQQLAANVDPIMFVDRYREKTMFCVTAGSDQFFMPDDPLYWRDEFEGLDFYERVHPNCEHSLRGCQPSLVHDIVGFLETFINPTDYKRPVFEAIVEAPDTIRIVSETPIISARVWQAVSIDDTLSKIGVLKDFRWNRLNELGEVVETGIQWHETVLAPEPNGNYVAKVLSPSDRWTAFFVEVEFPLGPLHSIESEDGEKVEKQLTQFYTSPVSITPDTFPVEPCVGMDCLGVLR